MSSQKKEVQITQAGPNTISITFPEGTKARIRATVPLDELLETLGPTGDVEGQQGTFGGDEPTQIVN